MKFVNLTPHPVNLNYDGDFATIPSSVGDEPFLAPVPRVRENVEEAGHVAVAGIDVPSYEDDFLLHSAGWSPVANLPDPVEGTILIVSNLVRMAVPDRADVCSPFHLNRDDKGRVTSCSALLFNPREEPWK